MSKTAYTLRRTFGAPWVSGDALDHICPSPLDLGKRRKNSEH